jgi:hypothetical protein
MPWIPIERIQLAPLAGCERGSISAEQPRFATATDAPRMPLRGYLDASDAFLPATGPFHGEKSSRLYAPGCCSHPLYLNCCAPEKRSGALSVAEFHTY